MKIILLFLILLGSTSIYAQKREIKLISDNTELVEIFNWAKTKAYSFVQTNKKGPINVYNRDQPSETVNYIPSYWAGYPLRTAFYSRDFCHQAIGAHLLGLEEENFTMLEAFTKSATVNRKWFPLWAINFDSSPYELDYQNDDYFVREIPAAFELVEKSYQLYLWTKDERYLHNDFINTYNKKVTDEFIRLHDQNMKNAVAESNGKGNIFLGTSTYNEQADHAMIEAGDGIASQYQAFKSYAALAQIKNNKKIANEYFKRAKNLKKYFNTDWGIKANANLYNRGYSPQQIPISGWGKENSWFMPMKGITDANSLRHENYLQFIDEQLSTKEGLPVNIEAITYIPETFYKYGKSELGWKWFKYIISKINTEHAEKNLTGSNGDYPEVSYVLISNLVHDIMGIKPGIRNYAIQTLPQLPTNTKSLKLKDVKVAGKYYDVEQLSNTQTILTVNDLPNEPIVWRASFIGKHRHVLYNNKKIKCKNEIIDGIMTSYIDVVVNNKATNSVSLMKQ